MEEYRGTRVDIYLLAGWLVGMESENKYYKCITHKDYKVPNDQTTKTSKRLRHTLALGNKKRYGWFFVGALPLSLASYRKNHYPRLSIYLPFGVRGIPVWLDERILPGAAALEVCAVLSFIPYKAFSGLMGLVEVGDLVIIRFDSSRVNVGEQRSPYTARPACHSA